MFNVGIIILIDDLFFCICNENWNTGNNIFMYISISSCETGHEDLSKQLLK
jgi:hypothetical protein